MQGDETLIVLKEISKKFGEKQVLDKISCHIAPKETVGIVGLNGAGKTTLLNVIAGIIQPDEGFIRVNGTENVWKESSVLKKFSYISGVKSQLWPDLRVRDSFSHVIKMYQIDSRLAERRMEELDEIFEIKELLEAFLQKLSLGEKMRCELVYGLLHTPEILILDEAMIGLDVSIKFKIMQYFESYGKNKKSTFLVTSNNLMEVEKLCERIILIDSGKIIFDGKKERIMKEFSPSYRMKVKLNDKMPDLEDLPIEKFMLQGDEVEIFYDYKKIETEQILEHILQKTKILEIKLQEPDLETTIQKIYKQRKE